MTPILPLSPMIALLCPAARPAAHKDMALPNLPFPLPKDTSFGPDLATPHPSLGFTVTDPLYRMPR